MYGYFHISLKKSLIFSDFKVELIVFSLFKYKFSFLWLSSYYNGILVRM